MCACRRLPLTRVPTAGIPMGPINTFKGWQGLDRQVQRGQKAIVLCMPITCKRKTDSDDEPETTFRLFVYRANWFVLSQTDGETEPPELDLPEWYRPGT